MKLTIERRVRVEVDVATVEILTPVRYGEEDIPADFPGRRSSSGHRGYDVWHVLIDADTGVLRLADGTPWTFGPASVHMKVCDEGTYRLLARDGAVLLEVAQDYVPDWVPEGGDYVVVDVAADGTVSDGDGAPWATYQARIRRAGARDADR